jgi:hypothetical protein
MAQRKIDSRHFGASIHGLADLLTRCYDELAVKLTGQLPEADAMRRTGRRVDIAR